jgi:aminoglycoside phosphotransferase family enzyme
MTPSPPLRQLQVILAATAPGEEVQMIETHMSWVFLVGEQVFKLKKPVRFPFLDFSTRAARESACREELRLNARLAPGIYLGLMVLREQDGRFTLVPEGVAAPGQTVDWLVCMRRLPRERMLDRVLAEHRVGPAQIDALVAVLVAFYRGAVPVYLDPSEHLARFQREQAANREVLLRRSLRWKARPALDRFEQVLLHQRDALKARVNQRCIVDGHGDLRPEHVCLLEPPVVIDCIEFNPALRQVDPFDDLAFLALECDMAGVPRAGEQLLNACAAELPDAAPPVLVQFYTACRALLRARLAMAHLLDVQPRTPEHWPPLAQQYIQRGLMALDAMERLDALSPGAGHGRP